MLALENDDYSAWSSCLKGATPRSTLAPFPPSPSCSLPMVMPPAVACKDPYGEQWGPISRLRDFDLTQCFEEGLLLPGLLALFIVLQAFRVYVLSSKFQNLERSRKSIWVLRSKLVKFTVNCVHSINYDYLPCATLSSHESMTLFISTGFFGTRCRCFCRRSSSHHCYKTAGHVRPALHSRGRRSQFVASPDTSEPLSHSDILKPYSSVLANIHSSHPYMGAYSMDI